MTPASIRLHGKLYRAKAVDEAMSIAMESIEGCSLERKRDGVYHLVSLAGLEPNEAADLIAEVGDLALELTLHLDKK